MAHHALAIGVLLAEQSFAGTLRFGDQGTRLPSRIIGAPVDRGAMARLIPWRAD